MSNRVYLVNGQLPQQLPIERGYVILNKKQFTHWANLLEEWILIIERYCYETKGDVSSFADNEMCNVSLLASAAWRVGGIALCEKNVKRLNGNGRVDLWMRLCQSQKVELIEAKHTIHLDLIKKQGDQDKYDYTVRKRMAIDDAKKLQINDEKTIAVVFLSKKFKQNVTDINSEINNLLHHKYVSTGWDVMAWSFPLEARGSKDKPHSYPGIILSAKLVN